MGSCLSTLRKSRPQPITLQTFGTPTLPCPVVPGTSPGYAGQKQFKEETTGAGGQSQDFLSLSASTDENEELGVSKHDPQTLAISDCSPDHGGQEQGKGKPSGACGQPQHVFSSLGATDKNEETDIDIVQHTGQPPEISNPSSGYTGQEQGAEEVPGVSEQLKYVPSGSAEKNEGITITAIRATDVALGLRRLPAGFYVTLHHDGLEWRTENKPSSVNNDVVEWSGSIPISSDLSTVVRLEVYASFEFQPMLGVGEQLRRLTTTVGQLLDRSGRGAPFTFLPNDGDIVSPCSSVLVAIEQQKHENSDPSGSRVVGPHWSTPEPLGELEDATNLGHSALTHYQLHGEKQDLERSIQQFKRALDACPQDDPRQAAAKSNLAMANLSLHQVEGTDGPLEIAFRLYRDALAARPARHPDRPLTLIQLASAHFARLQRRRNHVDEANAEGLLQEAIGLSIAESHEMRVAILMLQLCAGHKEGRAQSEGLSSIEQDPNPSSTNENSWLGAWLLKRFERFGDLADLQRAITLLEGLVKSPSIRDSNYYGTLGNLGTALSYRFQHLGELSDLEDALSRKRDVVRFSPDGHAHKPMYLLSLGNSFLTRFERLGELSDLEDAISTHREAIRLCPDGHPDKPMCLDNLGNSFQTRFERLGELNDLEDAISTQREAVQLCPDGHPDKPEFLNNFGSTFQIRFECLGQLSDIENAISTRREAVHLCPDGHPDKPTYLNNLGNSFQSRFSRIGELSDLEDAISIQREAVHLRPNGHPHKPMYLNNLSTSLLIRFEHLGELNDLEDSISAQREAVHLCPHGHPDKPVYLNNLGGSFQTHFLRLGRLSDLEDAISTLREAVHHSPDGHPRKPVYFNNLGTSFRTRFLRLGELSDLEDAILTQREAVHLCPDSHPYKPMCLNNLGNSFQTRYERFGQISDLEDAVSIQREALRLCPDGHPHNPMFLNNLGNSLEIRYERLGELSDLEDAISAQREAVHLCPDDHPHKPMYLNNLSGSFQSYFLRLGELSDLEDTISTQRDAIRLSPDGHPDKSKYLTNLGTSLKIRFERLGELGDLEDAILIQREALRLCPDGHPDKPVYLHVLGISLRTRFERLRELSDLEDAISIQKDVVHLSPRDHPQKSVYLDDLARSFAARYLHLGQVSDIEHALSLCSHVASIPIASPSVRFSAVQRWIQYARLIRHSSLLHAYSVAVSLTPQLAWIGLSLSNRYNELTQGADIVREAAAAALDVGFPETALEWLEQGRSVIWGDLLQLRSPHEELSSAHSSLASRLRALSTQLDQASATHERSLSNLSEQDQNGAYHAAESLRQVADRHRALAIERDKLLQEIRRLPGFEKFLLRKPFSQLRTAAHSGPVVILNASETRCDALIVVAGVDHVIHVPLPNFTSERCVNLQVILKSFVRDTRAGKLGRWDGNSWDHILPPLWKCIVKPVLDALAFSVVPQDLSRIFWCPTGPLAFLPIHAAGFYNRQYSEPGHKIFDFVVSSYVPSFSTLIPPPSSAAIPSGDLRLLLVPQPPSDGNAKLPGVAVELRRINHVVSNSPLACTTLEPSDGTVEEVLDLMRQADWVHFACHGVQDGVDSGLCLANGRRLKLGDIVALSRPRGGLAFLSACQTAKGDQLLSDEAIHIAAGMLFAGYGGVVGTMWSISDAIAPDVAKDVYEELLGKGARANYREAARALHEATKDLRRRGKSIEEWIPFIHVGL